VAAARAARWSVSGASPTAVERRPSDHAHRHQRHDQEGAPNFANVRVLYGAGPHHHEVALVTERATRAERERETATRIAVTEERLRIARELHDVVAHAVSVMVLQVGALRHKLPDALAEDRDALSDVEQAGRTAPTASPRWCRTSAVPGDRRDVSECTHRFPPDLWRVRDRGPRHRYASSPERAAPLCWCPPRPARGHRLPEGAPAA
jgi:hypothetical protein